MKQATEDKLSKSNSKKRNRSSTAAADMITSSKSCKLDRNDVIETTKIDDKVLHRIESEDLANATTNADVSTNVFHSFMGQYLMHLPDSASRSQVVDEIIATFQRKPLGAMKKQ